MRIAVLADPIDNQSAGVHVYTRAMVEALIRSNPGHEIILVREKSDPELNGVQQIAVPNTRLPIGFASLRLFFIIPFLLRRKKVDVVVEPAHFGPFNLPASVKRITIIHDLTPLLFPELHRWHSQVLQRIFLKGILQKTDLIIANSDHTAKDLCSVFPKQCHKVQRIYPGIRKSFGPAPDYDVLSKYKITAPYFLFVGTIEPRKGLDTLLQAFEIFCNSSEKKTELVIAGGEGWKSDGFFQQLHSHPYRDRIIVTGFVETAELPALYSSAIALVYPSRYEGFGLPIVEATMFGTPVITSDNSSLREAGGDAALYTETGNADQLAVAMITLASDPEARAGLSALAKAHNARFSWDHFAAEFWKQAERINGGGASINS